MNIERILQSVISTPNLFLWIRPIVVLIITFVLSSALTNLIYKILYKIAVKTKNKWDDGFVNSFKKPIKFLIILAGIYTAVRITPFLYTNKGFFDFTVKLCRSLVVLIVMWGLYNMEDSSKLLTATITKKFDLQVNNVLFPFVSKALRFITVAIALLVIAQEWNFSVSGLLAGLGLGGLAFALAAKDMLTNIFGGVVILLDKPFRIGDWIQTDSVEGTIEDINFRSVKIRTFSQALVTVPNTAIVDGPITNFSRMGKRRVNFTLNLNLSTDVDRLKNCTTQIRKLLFCSEDLEEGTSVVTLDSIDQGSLQLLITFYTKTTEYARFVEIREDIYYAILDILKCQDVKFASPENVILFHAKEGVESLEKADGKKAE